MLGVFPVQTESVRVFVYPDTHHPYEDKNWLAYLDQKCDGFNPHAIIHIGDGVDAYPVSNFTRNPARKMSMQDEFDSFTAWWHGVRRRNPAAEMHYCKGNHDDRWERFIWGKAPEFADLRVLGFEKMMKAEEIGYTLHGRTGFKKWGIRFKHGDLVRKGAGNTARGEMDEHRCDGVSGHTHRVGRVQRTDKEGHTTQWIEIGHAADLSQVEYLSNPDWQLGGLKITVHHDRVPEFEIVEA